jgi:NADPH2 dehydrogenase
MSTSRLFEPVTVGDLALSSRIVFAPLTRMRTNPDRTINTALAKEYYAQRAHTQRTLLVTEMVCVAPQTAGFPGIPGFWTDAHVAAWKEVRAPRSSTRTAH